MCGIVGAMAKRPVVDILLNGLKKLEYRGYDSAGIALLTPNGNIVQHRVVGKVSVLEKTLASKHYLEQIGIAHTRWATHGSLSEHNAHPFISHNALALVHNGIIDNDIALRKKLIQKGYVFHSETDSEVIVHLIYDEWQRSGDLLSAIYKATQQLEGAYALGILAVHQPTMLFAVRKGSPLVVGQGQQEFFLASDALALSPVMEELIYLEDGEVATLSAQGIAIYNRHQKPVKRPMSPLITTTDIIDRGHYRHYMQKEIMDQPDAVAACLEGRLLPSRIASALFGQSIEAVLSKIQHVHLVACGTSYHAALIARYWIESIANLPCTVEIASEFRYRKVAVRDNSLLVALSQSGETADTLAALRYAKQMHYLETLAICNRADSSLVHEAGGHCLTRAGIEIGVAATKTFLTQLVVLLLLACTFKQQRTASVHAADQALLSALQKQPACLKQMLQSFEKIISAAAVFAHYKRVIFMGRGLLYPIALEGALKMKELSYLHAEGYPAGELKHGPLALIDDHMPVIALAPKDTVFEKNVSNIQEVRTRGGIVYVLTDTPAYFETTDFKGVITIPMPTVHPLLTPFVYTLPLQLLAYHVALLKGTDVDQPRNLAKSVTVE